jgi:hypothetical protein
MNYEKIYDILISKAQNRILETYTETHHIVPKCIGGTDNINNLVELTPEEHYLAHQLLVKIYPQNHSLVKAAAMMIPNRPSNKMYGWLKRRFAKAQSVSQTGGGNSQFGTRWIYNLELEISKKISISEPLPTGWNEGRKLKFSPCKKDIERKEKKEQRLQYLRELHEVYKNEGFEGVKKLGYPYSKPNLVQAFAKNLEEFIPQNGRNRGAKLK